MLGNTLLGKRLKDLRTVLAYLEARPDIDADRLGLWGDSLSPANPAHLLLDEQIEWQVGPEIEQQAEPLGGLLAVLGALYDGKVRTVAVQGGLSSFLSILDDNFAYVPADVIVPGILEAGDITELDSGLAPHPLLLQGLVDGRDRLVPAAHLESDLAPVYSAYRNSASATLAIRQGENGAHIATWFLNHLSSGTVKTLASLGTH